MRIELSGFIESDLDHLAAFITEDNPRRAVTFIRDIRAKFGAIARDPFLYQLRPDIGEAARLVTVGRYVILFRVVGEIVRIERVAYGGRDLSALFDQV